MLAIRKGNPLEPQDAGLGRGGLLALLLLRLGPLENLPQGEHPAEGTQRAGHAARPARQAAGGSVEEAQEHQEAQEVLARHEAGLHLMPAQQGGQSGGEQADEGRGGARGELEPGEPKPGSQPAALHPGEEVRHLLHRASGFEQGRVLENLELEHEASLAHVHEAGGRAHGAPGQDGDWDRGGHETGQPHEAELPGDQEHGQAQAQGHHRRAEQVAGGEPHHLPEPGQVQGEPGGEARTPRPVQLDFRPGSQPPQELDSRSSRDSFAHEGAQIVRDVAHQEEDCHHRQAQDGTGQQEQGTRCEAADRPGSRQAHAGLQEGEQARCEYETPVGPQEPEGLVGHLGPGQGRKLIESGGETHLCVLAALGPLPGGFRGLHTRICRSCRGPWGGLRIPSSSIISMNREALL